MSNKPKSTVSWWQSPVVWVGALGIAALAVVIALNVGGSSDTTTAVAETGAVSIDGSPLPPFTTPDAGIGLPVPDVTATAFDGEQVQLTADGTARIYGFFAHWCPHCQAELPRTGQWLEDNELPNGVEVVAISTGVDETAPNYPPSKWFAREDWPATVMIDSETSDMANAFGLTAFPYWVVADADGNVVTRLTGEINEAQLAELVNSVTP